MRAPTAATAATPTGNSQSGNGTADAGTASYTAGPLSRINTPVGGGGDTKAEGGDTSAWSGNATGGNGGSADADGGNATAKNLADVDQSNQSNGSGSNELTQQNTSSITRATTTQPAATPTQPAATRQRLDRQWQTENGDATATSGGIPIVIWTQSRRRSRWSPEVTATNPNAGRPKGPASPSNAMGLFRGRLR